MPSTRSRRLQQCSDLMPTAAKTAAAVQDTVASQEAVATQGIFDSLVGTSAQVGTAAQGTGIMQGLVTAKRIVDYQVVAGAQVGAAIQVDAAAQVVAGAQVGGGSASVSAATQEDSGLPRKRGRPKGSKNKKTKAGSSTREPNTKRARTKGAKAKPMRSLEAAMSHETPSADRVASETAVDSLRDQLPLSVYPPATAGQYVAPARPPVAQSSVDTASVSEPTRHVSAASTQVDSTPPPATGSRRSTSGHSPYIAALYVNTLVAFAPAKEGWASTKKCVGVGNAYIIGRVCRVVKGLYQVRWLDSQLLSHVENLTLSMVQRGNTNYSSLNGQATGPGWERMCAVEPGEAVNIDSTDDSLEMCMESYEPPQSPPNTVAEVEAIKNFRFDPTADMTEPADLYHHGDTSLNTRLREEFRHILEHSASASFFAYIPISFWRQVVGEMNAYAQLNDIAIATPLTLQEIMTFLGILFYMSLVDKGEYSNYWGAQIEDDIFGGSSVGLDNAMPLRRFKQFRQYFTFHCVPPNRSSQDQAARIRPLLNLLKSTGSKYLEVGRNVALDEASVACRLKYGKPLIVYNPMKPVGKYHFRIYMLCCAASWISLNFRLHCQSTIEDRLSGVTTAETASALSEEISSYSVIRKCVLEVARPVYGARRVVNSDNYYTSVQLVEALRVKGLHSRGTVRKSSAHFSRHVLIEKKECSRGSSRQAVSRAHNIVAASWFDSALVTVISNADPSTLTTVERQVQAEKCTFSAPTCVKEYNTYMQGVDRLDRMRARFSVSDGHSFKKWHKKLGLDVG